jgi:uncharacterized membrane protein
MQHYPYWEHAGHGGHAFGWLLGLLLFALLVGVIAGLVARWLARREANAVTPVPAAAVAGPGPGDDALGLVRLRYARGEIDREQFLQASADLGGVGGYPVAGRPPDAPTA